MKKAVSVILSAIMILSFCVPVFAQTADRDLPVIYLHGLSNCVIYDADGNNAVADVELEDVLKNKELMGPIMSGFVYGLATDDWQPYCDAFTASMVYVYGRQSLDKNGEATNGTYVKARNGVYSKSSNYGISDYVFRYDWRLSPLELADKLSEYIDAVLKATGKNKVTLIGRCYGSSVVNSYLKKYSDEDKVDTVIYYVPSSNGVFYADALFRGDLNINAEDVDNYASFKLGGGDIIEDGGLRDMIISMITILSKTGGLDMGVEPIIKLYNTKLKDKLVPQVLRATFATYPSYWTFLDEDKYEEGLDFVFGGYEDEYAGIIEKTKTYFETVQLGVEDFNRELAAKGVRFMTIAKYGYNLMPISDGADQNGDGSATTEALSFGATCSKIDEKLSDEYLSAAVLNGTDKYLSADGKIDASTCLFPETTWFIKNSNHDHFPKCIDELINDFRHNSGTMTVFDNEKYPQFMLYNDDTQALTPVTDHDPCDDRYEGTNFLEAFFKFIKNLFRLIKNLFDKIGK